MSQHPMHEPNHTNPCPMPMPTNKYGEPWTEIPDWLAALAEHHRQHAEWPKNGGRPDDICMCDINDRNNIEDYINKSNEELTYLNADNDFAEGLVDMRGYNQMVNWLNIIMWNLKFLSRLTCKRRGDFELLSEERQKAIMEDERWFLHCSASCTQASTEVEAVLNSIEDTILTDYEFVTKVLPIFQKAYAIQLEMLSRIRMADVFKTTSKSGITEEIEPDVLYEKMRRVADLLKSIMQLYSKIQKEYGEIEDFDEVRAIINTHIETGLVPVDFSLSSDELDDEINDLEIIRAKLKILEAKLKSGDDSAYTSCDCN